MLQENQNITGEATEEQEQPVGVLDEETLPEKLQKFHKVFKEITTNIAKTKSLEEREKDRPVLPPDADDEAKATFAKEEAKFQAKIKCQMYGELGIQELRTLLDVVKSQDMPLYANKGVFMDLGSGVGKACVAAQLLHPFEKVVGIETVPCLHDFANKAAEKEKEFDLKFAEGVELAPLQFIKGDFVQPHLDEKGQVTCSPEVGEIAGQVAVCLAFSTSFGEDQILAMTDFASKMPDGSYLITIGQGLPDSATFGENRHPYQRRAEAIKNILGKRGTDPSTTQIPTKESFEQATPIGWEEVACKEVKVSWGTNKYYIYKKIPGPFTTGNHWGLAKWTDGDGPWPQLVGLKKEDAEDRLKKSRDELKVVVLELDEASQTLKEPEPPVEDNRVVIRYDVATGLVTDAPFREKEVKETPPA